MSATTERRVLLAVTGSVAAYKAAEVLRGLRKAGCQVQALMTPSAREFIGEATLLGLSGRPVYSELFDGAPGERHVELWQGTTAMLIVPATADTLAKLAQGRCDDLVSATAACRRGPLFVAPAMHPAMWANPAVARNVERLLADGVRFLGPVDGEVASGDSGLGRMMDPAQIVTELCQALETRRDLVGRQVVVSAGPTFEDVDPVRFLGNRSSGKMGYALARAARDRGAEVTLVTGPVHLEPPMGVSVVRVRSALEMQTALESAAQRADLLVMAAAVADFRPAERAAGKIGKDAMPGALPLVRNPDIVRGLARARSARTPLFVAFALETGEDDAILESAQKKLRSKGVDFVVANAARDGFEGDDNRAAIVDAQGATPFERSSKLALAHRVLDRALLRLET